MRNTIRPTTHHPRPAGRPGPGRKDRDRARWARYLPLGLVLVAQTLWPATAMAAWTLSNSPPVISGLDGPRQGVTPFRAAETPPAPAAREDAETLGRLVDALLVLMNRDLPVERRAEAALSIGRLGDTRGIVPLIYALTDPSPQIQLAVVQALGGFTSPAVETALAAVLQDPGRMETIRAAAAGSLGAQRTESARTVLYTVFRRNREPQAVRQACSEALNTYFPGYLASLGENARAVDQRGRRLLVPASSFLGAYALGTVGRFGRSKAAVPIGLLSGLVLGGAGPYLLTQNAEMTTAQAASIVSGGAWGLSLGIMAGRMGTGGNYDEDLVATTSLVGELVGLAATTLTVRRNPYSFGDIVTINLAGLAGHNLMAGALLIADQWNPTPAKLATRAVTSLASLAGGAAIARRLTFTDSDRALVAYGTLQGGWIGAWLPTFHEGWVQIGEPTGGLLMGSAAGMIIAAAVSQETDLDRGHPLLLTTLWAYGNMLGAGIPLLAGADDRRTVGGPMLLTGVAGETAGVFLRNRMTLDGGDAALTALGTVWGAWEGVSLGAYLDSRSNTSFDFHKGMGFGASLTGTAVGGLGTLALSQTADLSPWEVLMLASGGMWGSWFSFWGNALADSDPKTVWASNLIASNAALASTAILMSPLIDVHPTRMGIADLAGMSGAAIASLGAALATDDPDTIVTANIIGSGVGLVAGALVASRVEVVHEPKASGRLGRALRYVKRWQPNLSVVPVPAEAGTPTTMPGWYASISVRQPVPR